MSWSGHKFGPGLLALPAAFGILYFASLHSFHLFHILAELFSIVVGCGAFMVAWNTRRVSQNNYILFVGVAYLFVGFIDLLHALTYQGLGVFPGATPEHPIQFWIAARYLDAFALLLAPYFLGRCMRVALVWAGLTAAAGGLVAAIYFGVFPSCYADGATTAFKTNSEYVVCAIIGAAIYLTRRKREHFEPRVLSLLTWAMAVTILAELSFSSYAGVFGTFNKLGHYLKILSFYLIYKATIEASLTRPYETLFLSLKRNEENLRRNQEILQAQSALLDLAHDAILVLDLEGRITYWSQGAQRTYGWQGHEALGQEATALLKTQFPNAPEEIRRQVLEQGEWEGRLTQVNRQGQTLVMDSRWALQRDGQGQPTGILEINRDVTLTHQAEERLKQLSQEYSDLYHHSPCGYHSLDADGVFVKVNQAELDWLGYTEDELVGKMRFLDLVTPASQEAFRKNFLLFKERGHVEGLEYEMVRRDGSTFWIQLSATAIYDQQGNFQHSRSAFVDISDRKRMEQDLQMAKEAAEAANQAKSTFLASMSHEIRTPLNGVIGMAGLLLDSDLTPQQRQFAETARASGEALLAIINDILDFSKIEAGRLEMESIPYSLRQLMDDSLDILAAKAADKGLELAAVAEPEVPAWVAGDPTRVRQVLVNLLSNAVKFTDRGEVVARASVRQGRGGEPELCMEVTDSGIGISDQAQSSLFQVFTQADTSTTRQYGGSGLGLAICKRLVEMMGGRIGVRSQPGRGSTFWFSLPLKPAQPPAPLERTSPDLSGVRALVLSPHAGVRAHLASLLQPWGVTLDLPLDHGQAALVMRQARDDGHPHDLALVDEDNPVNQQVAVHILGRLGYRVDVVGNGLEAVEAMRRHPYDLVLMDCQMPEMDGYAATMAIRRLEGASGHTPIVAMTAHALAGDREKCLAAGMDDYVSKPVRPSELAEALERRLSPAAAQEAQSAPPTQAGGDGSEVFDLEDLVARLDHDRAMAGVIIQVALEGGAERLAALARALAQGDAAGVHMQAHGLKGELANLSARAASRAAGEIERAAKAGDLALAQGRMEELERRYNELLEALDRTGLAAQTAKAPERNRA